MEEVISGVSVSRDRISQVIATVFSARENRTGLFIENIDPPERQFIELAAEHGRRIADDSFALHSLFLTVPFIRGQDTFRFFRRLADPVLLERNAWVFQPSEVISQSDAGVDIELAVRNYLHPAGYSAYALRQYVHNCRVLQSQYAGSIQNFFMENGADAIRIVNSLVLYPRAKTEDKKEFRCFGPKLARLFAQWVEQYKLYPLINADQIGLPVDFQLTRILIQTGGLVLEAPTQTHTLTYKVVLPILEELCTMHGWNPQIVSESLWLIGALGCNKRNHIACPVVDMCDRLISRAPYDNGGKFDPTDVGRYEP